MGKSDPIWWHVPIQTHISKELFNINPLHFTLWISTLWNHINQGQHFFSIMWEWCLWKPYPPWKFCCPHLPGKLEDVTLPYKGVLQRGPLCFPIFAFRPHLSLFLLRLLLNDLLSFSMSGLPSESSSSSFSSSTPRWILSSALSLYSPFPVSLLRDIADLQTKLLPT